MKMLSACLMFLLLSACGKPAPTDTVESLAANPERLAELRTAPS